VAGRGARAACEPKTTTLANLGERAVFFGSLLFAFETIRVGTGASAAGKGESQIVVAVGTGEGGRRRGRGGKQNADHTVVVRTNPPRGK